MHKKIIKKKLIEIFNIAGGKTVKLSKFISTLEKKLGKKAKKKYTNIQKGDIIRTCGSIKKIKKFTGYTPKISVKKGISNFVDWYKSYYLS